MTRWNYILRSLWHYRKSHFAVLLGVIAGTAVITGALIVGDSVRGSLQQISLESLKKVDYAMVASRFFREELAQNLEKSDLKNTKIAPGIVVSGSLQYSRESDNDSKTSMSRIGKVHLYGASGQFWDLLEAEKESLPKDDEVVINQQVANQLEAKVGDSITLFLDLPSAIPRDTLLGEREEVTEEIELTVSKIVDSESGPGRFSLRPNQQLPPNAFVSLAMLQDRLGLAKVNRTRRTPVAKPARVNALFFNTPDISPASKEAFDYANQIESAIRNSIELADLNLRLVPKIDYNDRPIYLSLESERLIVEKSITKTIKEVAERQSLKTSPVLVYLANEFANPKDKDVFSMYSIVAGIDFNNLLYEVSPFGPFQSLDGEPIPRLKTNEIILNDWLAEDLEVEIGDTMSLKYHTVESHGDLPEKELEFKVAQIIKLKGTPADDKNFTPRVEGFTTVKRMADFDQPFPMDMDRVTGRDDSYWEDYRATPKAFVSLERAQELWGSRYGDLTSFRIAVPKGTTSEELTDSIWNDFRSTVPLKELGLLVRPAKAQSLQAASGTTDFAGLFFGFSLFLILAASILVGLLFRLSLERRARELGVLTASGFSRKSIQWLSLGEAMVISVVGSLIGLLVGIGYARLMIYGLTTWWFGAVGTKNLYLFLQPTSLVIGMVISLVITVLVLLWSLRSFRKVSTRSLLHGVIEVADSQSDSRKKRSSKLAVVTGGFALLLTFIALAQLLPQSEAFSGLSWQVVTFFLVGFLLLLSGIFFFSSWLQVGEKKSHEKLRALSVESLGVSNTSRQRQRSMTTVAMISTATFLVIAVAAGQYNPTQLKPELKSGNGGFTLVSESSRPILFDWNTESGQKELNLDIDNTPEQQKVLNASTTFPFRVHAGEESSCLNLYQTQLPTILGVPLEFIERGGFAFANTPGENPWELLTKDAEDGTVPVLGDMNTLMFSLHKGIGQKIDVPESAVEGLQLKVAGMLSGSVFQGVLLMSEKNFRKVFPDKAGFAYFLTEVDPENASKLSLYLETRLNEFGLDVEPVSDRLLKFLSVQNTYLSTFQTLGGLGLLLGTFGLATVMLRNVLERRSELALFQAVGFEKSAIAKLVLSENGILLLSGLSIGTIAALIAMSPHLASRAADVPWLSLSTFLFIIFATGMLAALFAVKAAIQTPIASTLQGE